eukprot:5900225-Amphidinium_carterae.1
MQNQVGAPSASSAGSALAEAADAFGLSLGLPLAFALGLPPFPVELPFCCPVEGFGGGVPFPLPLSLPLPVDSLFPFGLGAPVANLGLSHSFTL